MSDLGKRKVHYVGGLGDYVFCGRYNAYGHSLLSTENYPEVTCTHCRIGMNLKVKEVKVEKKVEKKYKYNIHFNNCVKPLDGLSLKELEFLEKNIDKGGAMVMDVLRFLLQREFQREIRVESILKKL